MSDLSGASRFERGYATDYPADVSHYLSLGAGVQSSTLALMAALGQVTPMPTAAIFADTQAEPPDVYRWLDWLEKQLPFPVHRVTAGSLEKAVLTPHVSKAGKTYHKTAIPFFTRSESGEIGRIMHRTCTRDYKIKPIVKAFRLLASVKRGAKTPALVQWIGISMDEITRVKPARDPWIVSRWPLIEQGMTRAGCIEWMLSHGFPEPPRSACEWCPLKHNREWMRQKESDPASFARAVTFDRKARELRGAGSEVYVHNDAVPLDQVDLRSDTDRGQGTLWDEECEGMCGV